MILKPLYTESGKWYLGGGKLYPSAGRIVELLTQDSYEHVPLDSLEKARMEGEGAHRVAGDYALFRLRHYDKVEMPPVPATYPGTDEEWRTAMEGTFNATVEFYQKHAVQPLAIEQPGLCTAYRFAGQPDLKCELTYKGRVVTAVPDYKRVASVTEHMRLKIACYRMLDAYKDCTKGFILWFKKGGGWELVEVKEDPHDRNDIAGAAAVIHRHIRKGLIDLPILKEVAR